MHGKYLSLPAAHCVFQEMVNQADLADQFFIDSAGTIGFHEGNEPDSRMQDALRKRKYQSLVNPDKSGNQTLKILILFLAMDHSNLMMPNP